MVTATELVDRAAAILLDFDGPVCSVFAGLPASQVAADLRARLSTVDSAFLRCSSSEDPVDILRVAGTRGTEVAVLAEGILAAAERHAVDVAVETEGAAEFLHVMRGCGTRVAIVSNNGEGAIRAYLEGRSLSHLVAAISARDVTDLRTLKPHPRSLVTALQLLSCGPSEAVMIGDSVSDIEAAHALGLPVVGFANREHKVSSLADAGADAIVRSMVELIRPGGRPVDVSGRRR